MRSRSPKRVFQTTQAVIGTSSSAMRVNSDRSLTSPREETRQVGDEEHALLVDVAEEVGCVDPEEVATCQHGERELADTGDVGRLGGVVPHLGAERIAPGRARGC